MSARAAVYVRVSTDAQEDGSSLATQEAACRAYAETQGYTVTGIYRETFSGAELWERPQLDALHSEVKGCATRDTRRAPRPGTQRHGWSRR